ncbi:hypothetical protein [Nocardia macrotermitis]|uniref:Uncharacterized protein n=1 Tax=Nocardia macrotermitis TaxID=2585198 RepID=A0A7K0D4R5_9NOCA|nr:hypothetical protein [Nocardia macrotermitis]MQY20745.1 hypothetical protein [Nocardia macrotermitis]
MHGIAGWWDGFELWVAGLPFLPQFAVVLIGMVPISFLIAYLLDRLLHEGLRALGRDRAPEPDPISPIDADNYAEGPDDELPHPLDALDYGPQPLEYGPQPLGSRSLGTRQKETV